MNDKMLVKIAFVMLALLAFAYFLKRQLLRDEENSFHRRNLALEESRKRSVIEWFTWLKAHEEGETLICKPKIGFTV